MQHQLHLQKHQLLHLLILCVDSSVQHQLHYHNHELLHLFTLFVGASVQHHLSWQPMLMRHFSVAALNFSAVSLNLSFFYNMFLVHPHTEGYSVVERERS